MATALNDQGEAHQTLLIARAEWYISKLPMIYAGNAVAAVGLSIGLWLIHEHSIVLLWAVASLGHIALCRTLTWRRAHQPVTDFATAKVWARYLVFSSLLQGVIWGAVAPLFLQLDSPLHIAVVLLVLVANVASAVPLLSSHPSAFVAFAIPAFVPVVVVLALGGGVFALLAVFAAVLLLVSIGLSLDTYRTIAAALRLRLEREALAERLQQQVAVAEDAVRAKSRFLAAASHDLRQPLTALNLFASELAINASDGRTRGLATRVNQSLEVLNDLFDSLLDISRLEAGALKSEPHDTPVQPTFTALEMEFMPQAEAKGLCLRIRPTPAWVHTDPVHLHRMLANLVANAIRHTQQGAVLVTARPSGGDWRIEVRDSGPGIPAAEQRAVFQEFYQLPDRRNSRKGLGLGLAIVRQLAALLNIELGLASAAGRGSTFSLQIPRVLPGEVVETAPDVSSLTGTRVLVIEDEPDVREALRSRLAGWGCRVSAVADMDQALALLEFGAESPDLILSDYRLGGEADGLDAIRAVRRAAGTTVPAAILTGDSLSAAQLRTEPQPLRLLRKPIRPAQLRLLVASLREQSSKTDNGALDAEPAKITLKK